MLSQRVLRVRCRGSQISLKPMTDQEMEELEQDVISTASRSLYTKASRLQVVAGYERQDLHLRREEEKPLDI